MNKYLIRQSILFLVCFFVGFKVNAQENFKGIIPMVTTKSEVEKKLGKPDKYSRYELDEGRVYIRYYERECEKKTDCFCLAPLGTVQFISIELYYDLYLKDLNLDPQKFKETRDSKFPDIFTYSDSKSGVVYEVYEGKVSHIYYYESEDTCNNLKQKFSKPESQSKLNDAHASLSTIAPSNTQGNFKGIIPMVTTKAEVEKNSESLTRTVIMNSMKVASILVIMNSNVKEK